MKIIFVHFVIKTRLLHFNKKHKKHKNSDHLRNTSNNLSNSATQKKCKFQVISRDFKRNRTLFWNVISVSKPRKSVKTKGWKKTTTWKLFIR